jgi:nucleoside-diphosphate-sugar epimerase
MTSPEAAGKRFCCATEHAWMSEIAAILEKHFAARGYRIPTRKLPDFVLRVFALFDKPTRIVVNDVGRRTNIDNTRIKTVLDWQPRSLEEMVVSMGESMIEHGVV